MEGETRQGVYALKPWDHSKDKKEHGADLNA